MTRRRLGRFFLILPALLWVGAVLWFEGLYSLLLVGLSAVFHECGHLLAFSLLGLPAPKLVPVARGVRFAAPCTLSYREEMLIAMAGPVANLASFLFGCVTGGFAPAFRTFGDISLLTGLCNLAPMNDLDGERILRCLLAGRLDSRCLYYVGHAVTLTAVFLGGVSYRSLADRGRHLSRLPVHRRHARAPVREETNGKMSFQEHFGGFRRFFVNDSKNSWIFQANS